MYQRIVCPRSDDTKLMNNFISQIKIIIFFVYPANKTYSADEPFFSNIADPMFDNQRFSEIVMTATLFCFQIGFSAKKIYSISQETEFCRRLCWGASGQRPYVPWRQSSSVSAPFLHWAWSCAFLLYF